MQENYFRILILVCLTITAIQGVAQKQMRTVSDATTLKTNERQFVGYPLQKLLDQIGPQIKMVIAESGTLNQRRLGFFNFRFVESRTYDSIRNRSKYPVSITVFVKEPFEWDQRSKALRKDFVWRKEDAERLGKLTVAGIRVFGESSAQ